VSWRRGAAALLLSTALAVAHTWPLARDLDGQSRLDNADTALNTWIVAWVAHQLPRDPVRVFDAPIFHPERRTLAYSEHLLAQGMMAWPLLAAGLSATATFNLLVLAGLTLSAWAMWRLVAAWTNDEVAGAVAGCAFAFNAHLLTRFAHLQALHAEFVPVVLLAVDRLATTTRRRDAALLATGLVLVGLTSVYLLVFTAAAAAVGFAARFSEWRDRWRPAVGLAVTGAALGAICLAPVLWPYWQVNRELGLERTLADVAQFSATWQDYLSTGGRLHHALWSHRFLPGNDALFPGVTVVALAAIACVGRRAGPGRVRMLAAIALAGVVLSFGPAVPAYGWLFESLAPLRAIRVASRWGVLWLTGLAALAGIGAAVLRARVSRPVGLVLAGVLPALVTLEAARTPMAFTPTPRTPDIYARLATLPRAVVLEFPIFAGHHFNLNAPYLIAQTGHFHPLVSGYSGFATPSFTERVTALNGFPDERSHALITTLGVTHVVLHVAPLAGEFGIAVVDAVDRVPWLRREFSDDQARVFRVID
jgi:hypothetical protein